MTYPDGTIVSLKCTASRLLGKQARLCGLSFKQGATATQYNAVLEDTGERLELFDFDFEVVSPPRSRRGGFRPGARRPKGANPPKKVARVPADWDVNRVESILALIEDWRARSQDAVGESRSRWYFFDKFLDELDDIPK